MIRVIIEGSRWAKVAEEVSYDNTFSMVLGKLDIQSDIRGFLLYYASLVRISEKLLTEPFPAVASFVRVSCGTYECKRYLIQKSEHVFYFKRLKQTVNGD